MLHQPNYFILSGGPGSGKTTIIDRLAARGFATVGESGRAILRDQAEIGGNAVHGGDAAAFGELMLQRGIVDFRSMARRDEPVFFDRGIAELTGYWRLVGLAVPEHVREAARQYRSNRVVFLAPPWREIYRQDSERRQDWDEAVRTFDLVRDAYGEAGYTTVEIPQDTVARRVGFIVAKVDEAAGA
jgi:predicted ATPase